MFKTHYNTKPSEGASYVDIPSMATPDSAYSLRDLITQFASGVREFEEIVGNYDEKPNFDEVSPLNNPKFGLEDWSLEQHQIAQMHLQDRIHHLEQQQHLEALKVEEEARKKAVEAAKPTSPDS